MTNQKLLAQHLEDGMVGWLSPYGLEFCLRCQPLKIHEGDVDVHRAEDMGYTCCDCHRSLVEVADELRSDQ